MKLGIVAFIIPFMFVFEPALLMQRFHDRDRHGLRLQPSSASSA